MEVLDTDPQNIHANCNICLFVNERDGSESSQKYLDKIVNFRTEDPEELHKIAVTLCELKEHSKANRILKNYCSISPMMFEFFIM